METLLPYYERELEFLRQMGAEFAAQYPKVAGRLQLERDRCDDPHVERLLEGFALLAGRVQHKIDDEFPEVTESLLDLLYPHFLRPIPSMAIAQFDLAEGQSKPDKVAVPAGTVLHSRPVEGSVCTFRTAYDVQVWPIRVSDVSVISASAAGLVSDASLVTVIRMRLQCRPGLTFAALGLSRLQFYLGGDASDLLYELLLTALNRVVVRSGDAPSSAIHLTPSAVSPLGFSASEAVLPFSDRSFEGYRLLQEYFAFPEKFRFVEIRGLDGLLVKGDPGSSIELLFCVREFERQDRRRRLEQTIGQESFQLGCTPAVNLFDRYAEPIRLNQSRFEYRVVPDQYAQATTEVFSINELSATSAQGEKVVRYAPLYSTRHAEASADDRFWFARRRPATRKGDRGTEVYLTLVDLNLDLSLPPAEILTAAVTCTNRDFPASLPWRTEWGEVSAEGQALVRTRFVRKPTWTVRPPLGKGLHWRLISHLSLNHLSIVAGGAESLREILRLYEFVEGGDGTAIRKQIAGITEVRSKPAVSRVAFSSGVAFCRGMDVEVLFDEEQFSGSGVFLFASVLERFFGLYSALNSFSRLTARTSLRREVLKQWPPLAGEQRIL